MLLDISQTHAQIGIETTRSMMEIRTLYPQLEIHQEHARVNIRTELPMVEIDQYECFASAGLKNNSDMIAEYAQMGYAQSMQYIGQKSSDGDMLGSIRSGGNPIAEIAKRDSQTQHEFGMVIMPSVGPKISVRGNLEMEAERNVEGIHNGVEAEFTPGEISFNYTPADVRIYMLQYGSVNISYQGKNVDTYI